MNIKLMTRRPCPFCGGKLIGIGWGEEKARRRDGSIEGKEWCSVICRGCSARGPSCWSEDDAWNGWNARSWLYNFGMTIRTIDLFAGIGGIRLGFERACRRAGIDHECVFASDVSKNACKVYRANFGASPDPLCDITTVPPAEVPDFDVALAGFPCQSFSISGMKKGFDDVRGTLFFNLAKVLEVKKPKAFLFENVKHLIHHDGGRTLGRIMEVLAGLGYNASWKMLNSRNFGVPQNRPRVYIVGFRGFGGGFDWPVSTDKGKRLRDILEVGADEKYFISRKYWEWLKRHRARHEEKGNQFGYVVRKGDGVSGTILCGGMGTERNLVVDMATTIANPETNDEGIRRMTPTEWERLQGLDGRWTSCVSDTSRMDLLGNSVTVNVIEAVSVAMLAEISNPVRLEVSLFG